LQKHPRLVERTHHSAIKTALLPKVSCNRDGTLYNTHANQGVGLTTTAKIAEAARGGLVIVSGDSIHRSREKSGYVGVLPNGGSWGGVATCFQCRRNLLPTIRVGDLLPEEEHVVAVNFSE
jgi:hypothetical protein